MNKTRCKQCIHAKKKAITYPCCNCNEIQMAHKGDSHFVDSKDLMKEG